MEQIPLSCLSLYSNPKVANKMEDLILLLAQFLQDENIQVGYFGNDFY